jgi:hypothetical protein
VGTSISEEHFVSVFIVELSGVVGGQLMLPEQPRALYGGVGILTRNSDELLFPVRLCIPMEGCTVSQPRRSHYVPTYFHKLKYPITYSSGHRSKVCAPFSQLEYWGHRF